MSELQIGDYVLINKTGHKPQYWNDLMDIYNNTVQLIVDFDSYWEMYMCKDVVPPSDYYDNRQTPWKFYPHWLVKVPPPDGDILCTY